MNLLITALALLLIYVSFNFFNQDYELDTFADIGGGGPNGSEGTNHPRLMHTYVSIICAGIGVIVALIALLGLLGALRKSKTILGTYALIILFLISILLVMIILTYTMNGSGQASGNGTSSTSSTSGQSNYREIDKSYVNSTVVVYNYVDSNDIKTRIIDNIQRSFACCGVNSPNDWTEYSLHKIPKSCCSEPVESSLPVFKYCAESDHKIGCAKVLMDHFYANLPTVRAILYLLISFGLICSAAAGFMIRTLKGPLDVV